MPVDALRSDAALPSAATWRRVAHAVRASRLLSRPVSASAAGMLRAKVSAPHVAQLLRSALQRHTRLLSVAEPSSAPHTALRPAENAAALLASPRRVSAGGGRSSAGALAALSTPTRRISHTHPHAQHTTECSVPTAHCSTLDTHSSLLTYPHYSLLTAHYPRCSPLRPRRQLAHQLFDAEGQAARGLYRPLPCTARPLLLRSRRAKGRRVAKGIGGPTDASRPLPDDPALLDDLPRCGAAGSHSCLTRNSACGQYLP